MYVVNVGKRGSKGCMWGLNVNVSSGEGCLESSLLIEKDRLRPESPRFPPLMFGGIKRTS